MMAYCSSHLTKITFYKLSSKELSQQWIKLEERFKKAVAIKGTHAFHYFKPVGATRLGMKLISDDKQFSLETDIISSREDISAQNTNIGQYASALYDNWYIGIVQHIDKTNKDVFLQLMHPKGPSHYFYWPENKMYTGYHFSIFCVQSLNQHLQTL